MNEIIDNDTGEFTSEPVEFVSGAVAAEISQQVATAKRYPRRSDKSISTEIMSRATLDEDTAAECCYSLPRAGKDIVGPSVRFAELVFASYGNMRAGARFVELDTKDPMRSAVIVEGVCIDLQMNNAQSVPVRRSITGRKGVFNADMTNIAFSAGAAIARREAILKTVPKSIWGAAWKGVLAVLQGDQKTLATRRQSALTAFEKMGVEASRVLTAMEVADVEGITLEHMPRLLGMWTALRDGTETIDSLFSKGGPGHEVVKNPLKDDPISSGPVRGNEHDVNMADTVIDPNGQIIKARGGVPAAPIVDQRLAVGKQKFSTIEAWVGATQHLAEPVFPGASSNEAAKSDTGTISETIARNADAATQGAQAAAAERTGTDTPAPEKTAQAGPAAPTKADSEPEKPYTDAAGYMGFIRDTFDAAKTKSTVTEVWSSTRTDRQQLLDPDQIDILTAEKEAKLQALKKGA